MRCLDLFSGIGGFALACEWAGIETASFCEIDPYCRAVLKKHWPNVPNHPDIRTLKRSDVNGPVDLVCGGFPCQPYSVAGKQRGKEDDRDLWPEMLRIVREFRPTWVCGENVAGFVGMGLDSCLADLEDSGYQTRVFLLPAMAVGVPHQRIRTFVVANSVSGHSVAGCESEVASNKEWDAKTDFGRREDGRHGNPCNGWWCTEPDVGRVANGVPRGMDRLRALGNAVVPQQVYPILNAIARAERQRP